ncbi:MAG: hypothetical protein QOJ96_3815 [Alphaproteobacteria bacterium]|jgi:hypothetical protein|nr:hypothetical protein [Alphaproteobacteria bacterium]
MKNDPRTIGMNDSQYFWYTGLIKHQPRAIYGVPIYFLDAPKELQDGMMI